MIGQLCLSRLLVLRLDILEIGRENDLAVDDEPAVLRVADLGVGAVGCRPRLQEEINPLLKTGLAELLGKDLLSLAALKAGVRRKRFADPGQLLRDVTDAADVLADRLGQLRMLRLRLLRRGAKGLELFAEWLQNTLQLLGIPLRQVTALRLERLRGKIRKLLLQRLDRCSERLLLLLQESLDFGILLGNQPFAIGRPFRERIGTGLVLRVKQPLTGLLLLAQAHLEALAFHLRRLLQPFKLQLDLARLGFGLLP